MSEDDDNDDDDDNDKSLLDSNVPSWLAIPRHPKYFIIRNPGIVSSIVFDVDDDDDADADVVVVLP